MRIPTGLLLPQDTLESPGFIIFTLFVGFNTLIYLGLTFAKFTPWPAPLPPERVRALLPPIVAKDFPMSSLDDSRRENASPPTTYNRRATTLQTLPLGCALTGALLLATAILNVALSAGEGTVQYVLQILISIAMLALAQAGLRGKLSVGAMQWSWITAMVAIVALLTYDAVEQDNPIGLAYAIVAMVAIAPIAMAWTPAIVGGIASLVTVSLGGVFEYQIQGLRWVLAALTAFIIGSVIMQLRLVSVDSLTLEQERANRLASTDPLTGVLSRDGLITMTSAVVGTARRQQQAVCVMPVRVLDLDTANRTYGSSYGDAVLETVARALQAVVREGDLVARWSGTRFVVLGQGERPDPETFAARVQSAVRDSGIALGKPPITVEVGTAAGKPDTVTLFDLVQQAEKHMVLAAQPAD